MYIIKYAHYPRIVPLCLLRYSNSPPSPPHQCIPLLRSLISMFSFHRTGRSVDDLSTSYEDGKNKFASSDRAGDGELDLEGGFALGPVSDQSSSSSSNDSGSNVVSLERQWGRIETLRSNFEVQTASATTCDAGECSVPDAEETFEIEFRPLQEDDEAQLKDLHEQWFPVKYHDDFYANAVRNRMAGTDEPLHSCVAVCKGRILGCIIGAFICRSKMSGGKMADLLVPNPDRHKLMFYIMTLGTVKSLRNRGLASILVRKCMELVESESTCGGMYLHVITYNDAAISFYEKKDFSLVEEIEGYYTIEGDKFDCYLYAWYCNGNRGHFTLFARVTNLVGAVWRGLSAPIYSMFRA